MIGPAGFQTYAAGNVSAYKDNYPSDPAASSLATKLTAFKTPGTMTGDNPAAATARNDLAADLATMKAALAVRWCCWRAVLCVRCSLACCRHTLSRSLCLQLIPALNNIAATLTAFNDKVAVTADWSGGCVRDCDDAVPVAMVEYCSPLNDAPASVLC